MPHGTSPKESISSPRPELYLELGRVRLGYPFGFGFFALLLKPSGTSRSRAHREVLRIAKFFVSRPRCTALLLLGLFHVAKKHVYDHGDGLNLLEQQAYKPTYDPPIKFSILDRTIFRLSPHLWLHRRAFLAMGLPCHDEPLIYDGEIYRGGTHYHYLTSYSTIGLPYY